MAESITEATTALCARVTYHRLPQDAVTAVKRYVRDAVGVMLAGGREPGGTAVVDYVRAQGSSAERVVAGTDVRTSAELAAFANGTMAHMVDYDDLSITWGGHPSCVLVPALVATGAAEHRSGRDFIAAYTAGWEVGARLALAVRHRLHEAGWHNVGVIGTMAAVGACSHLVGLPPVDTRTALGVGGSLVGGLHLNRGYHAKPMHAGNAARAAVLAVELVRRGFTATPNVFDGPRNLVHALVGERAERRMLDRVGDTLDILEPGGAIKLYASCGANHPMLDALLDLVRGKDIAPDDVAEVECHASATMPQILKYDRPTTGLEGKFSLTYTIAVAILDRRVGLPQFTDEAVRRPAAQRLMEHVRFVPNDASASSAEILAGRPQEVVVRLRSGEVLEAAASVARGRSDNPATEAELFEKFAACASPSLDHARVEAVAAAIDALEQIDDLATLEDAIADSSR